jgi:hypothetical protein
MHYEIHTVSPRIFESHIMSISGCVTYKGIGFGIIRKYMNKQCLLPSRGAATAPPSH